MARVRDAERSRGRILAAARDLFAEAGHDGVTMEGIAQRAGVNKRMIYYYFETKSALYLGVLEAEYAARREHDAVLDVAGLAPAEAVAKLTRAAFGYCRDNPAYIKLLGAENLSDARMLSRSCAVRDLHQPLLERLGEVLRRGVETGEFRADADPLQTYLTIASLCFFYFSNAATLSIIFGAPMRDAAAVEARAREVERAVLATLRPDPAAPSGNGRTCS